MTSTPIRPSQMPPWLLFVLAGLVWGASFMFIELGLTGMNSAQVAVGRLAFGVIALGVAMLVTRTKFITDWSALKHIAVVGFFLAGLPLFIWAWVGQYITSGFSAIFNATTPLLTLVLAAIFLPSERLSRRVVLGLLIGAVGLTIVVSPWQYFGEIATTASSMTFVAYAAALGATTCYAIGFVYLRRMLTASDYEPLAFTFAQIVAGFISVCVLALPFGALEPMNLNVNAVIAVFILGALGTGLAYVWNIRLVAAWGPVRTSMVTYVTPVVAVILGVVFLAEPLLWNEPVGMLVLFFGVALAQGLIKPRAHNA